MEDELKCPICFTLAENPFESSCCGNIFCDDCVTLFNEKDIYGKCPICRNNVSFRETSFAKRLLTNLMVECTYKCGEKKLYYKMKEHQKICTEKEYICKFESICKFQAKREQYLQHVVQSHSIHVLTICDNISKIREYVPELKANPAIEKNSKKEENNKDNSFNYFDYLRNNHNNNSLFENNSNTIVPNRIFPIIPYNNLVPQYLNTSNEDRNSLNKFDIDFTNDINFYNNRFLKKHDETDPYSDLNIDKKEFRNYLYRKTKYKSKQNLFDEAGFEEKTENKIVISDHSDKLRRPRDQFLLELNQKEEKLRFEMGGIMEESKKEEKYEPSSKEINELFEKARLKYNNKEFLI